MTPATNTSNGIFLRNFLQNNEILQRQNGETATEERQRKGGNY